MNDVKMDEYMIDAIVRFTDFNENEAKVLYYSGLKVNVSQSFCNTFGESGELVNTPESIVRFSTSGIFHESGNVSHEILKNLLRGERSL